MSTTSNAWYALHVLTGREQEVATETSKLPGVAMTSAPMVEYIDHHYQRAFSPLFGGYVFVNCVLDRKLYHALTEQDNVIRLLGMMPAGDLPEPIPDADMWWMDVLQHKDADAAISRYTGPHWYTPEVIGMSKGKRMEDGRVQITDGALHYYRDYITKVCARQHYAIVELPIGHTVHRLKFGITVER